MAARKEKLIHENGDVIYPCTVTDAVVNPESKTPLIDEQKKQDAAITHAEVSVSPHSKLPKWFMDSLVCWYNPKRQGLKNGVDIKEGVPFTLHDFSGKGRDMTMHNFAGKGMSGMDGWVEDFNNWTISSEVGVMSKSKNIVNVKVNNIVSGFTRIQKDAKLKSKQGLKVKIHGLPRDLKVSYAYYTPQEGVVTLNDKLGNGIHQLSELPENAVGEYFFFSDAQIGDSFTIEQLPLYEGALVFDGTDDYGISENQPILDDFTLIIKRVWGDLTFKNKNLCLTSKVSSGDDGAFRTDFVTKYGQYETSFGYSNQTPITKEESVVMTPLSYNGFKLTKGTVKDTSRLGISSLGANYVGTFNGALYDYLLFDRTLSPEEIEWVKKNVIEDGNLKKNGAIETTPDGKVYINNLGGYDGKDTSKAKDLEYLLKSFNPNAELPKWFMDALVCYYDPARQGLKNGVDIVDGKPFILKDFSPNHLDMTMYNFQGEGMSGMDGWALNFEKMDYLADIASVEVKEHSIHITEIKSNSGSPFLRTIYSIENGFNIKVKGIAKGIIIKYQYYEGGIEKYINLKNGINYLPKSEQQEKLGSGFQTYQSAIGACDITITILPLYEGALVFDGTDDYGISENQPILDDYTVMSKREWISDSNGAIASKRDAGGEDNGAFQIERNKLSTFSYGIYNKIKNIEGNIVVQTKKMYNDKPISIGDKFDTQTLLLGKYYLRVNASSNFALYQFLLFNRTLTDPEIDWVKRNVMGEVPQLNEYNISAINNGAKYTQQEAINALDKYLGTSPRNVGVKVTYIDSACDKAKTFMYQGGDFKTLDSWRNEPLGGYNKAILDSVGIILDETSGMYEYNGVKLTTKHAIKVYNSRTRFTRMTSNSLSSDFAFLNDIELLTNIPLENTSGFSSWIGSYLDVSMDGMFYGCKYIAKSYPIRLSQTKNYIYVTSMTNTFNGCEYMTDILGVYDVRKVKNFYNTFTRCNKLKNFKFLGLNANILIPSKELEISEDVENGTLAYMVHNAVGTSPITITLHSSLSGKIPQSILTEAKTKQITIAFA